MSSSLVGLSGDLAGQSTAWDRRRLDFVTLRRGRLRHQGQARACRLNRSGEAGGTARLACAASRGSCFGTWL